MSADVIAAACGRARRESRAWRCSHPLRRSLVVGDGNNSRAPVMRCGGCNRLELRS